MTEKVDKNRIILEIKDLTVEYHAGGEVVQAVNDMSFSLHREGSLALVGETGAGKTTVAKAIMSILPDPPAKVCAGKIMLNGENLLEMKEKQLRKIRGERISMIFQDPMTALSPVYTVGNQIEEAVWEHNKISRAEARERAMNLLELVGIPKTRYKEYPHQFSGGMRQRVVIAIALACTPDVLIADEPTTALDVTIQVQVLRLIQELKEQTGTSMILITHDLGIVAENCDDVAIVYAGEIVEMGSKEHIFNETTHPYTEGLFGALPDMARSGEKLRPIKGLPPDPANLPKGCKFHPRCDRAQKCCCCEAPPFKEVSPGHFVRCHF
ncbi:MAG: ABC transporter ATP-binding protein [Oscillospiraceae bacterium]|nr:ABC transporter ATP-binding protein [Oscillospiraceae bacterium]